MGNNKRKVVAIAIWLAFLGLVPSAEAECCGWYFEFGYGYNLVHRCADCTRVNLKYCGYGSCNLFGCNCTCRKSTDKKCTLSCCDRKKREADELAFIPPSFAVMNYTGHDVLDFLDIDKNGHLDEVEVKIFITRHGLEDDGSWRHLDRDGDNHLSAHEIDAGLLPM